MTPAFASVYDSQYNKIFSEAHRIKFLYQKFIDQKIESLFLEKSSMLSNKFVFILDAINYFSRNEYPVTFLKYVSIEPIAYTLYHKADNTVL